MTATCSNWKKYRLALRQEAGRGIICLFLEPADGTTPPAFAAGQCVNLRMPGVGPRAYFLSGPSEDRFLRLTIEVGDEPRMGAAAKLGKLGLGDEVELSEPYGTFTLEPGETPIVLLAEGIGCAAVAAFLGELAVVSPVRKVQVICQAANGPHLPLAEDIRKLASQMPNAGLAFFFTKPFMTERAGTDYDVAGPITVANIRSICLTPDADFYITGSASFTEALYQDLVKLGIIHSRIHTRPVSSE